MNSLPFLLTCVKGLGFGLLHALDSDHVAAVTTIVATGKGPRRAMAVGAWWGAGHAAAVVGVGALLVALGVRMPVRLARGFDLAVIVMLVALGLGALWRARRGQLTAPSHGHGHDHGHAHTHPPPARTPLRAAAVGLVHGASGTATVALAVLTELPDVTERYAYLVLFAAGATLGMTLLSASLAVSMRAATRRFALPLRAMYATAGCLSIVAAAALLHELLAGTTS
jgi:high-affinity nickel permease